MSHTTPLNTTTQMVQLAQKYCESYHDGKIRKGNSQPYSSHPFRVRDLLLKLGHDDEITQCIALLHDILEDTALSEQELYYVFGYEIYFGVCTLSRNITIPKMMPEIHLNPPPLFSSINQRSCSLLNREHITLFTDPKKQENSHYKERIFHSADHIKRIKIADQIDNTSDLHVLSSNGIQRKLEDSLHFYIPLALQLDPRLANMLSQNIFEYVNPQHFQEKFRTRYNLTPTNIITSSTHPLHSFVMQ